MGSASDNSIFRRACRASVAALMTTAVLLEPAVAQAPKKPASLTLNVFSGVYEACFKKAVVPGFESRSGIKLKLVTTQPPVAKLQAQGDDPEIDVFVAGQSDMRAAYEMGVLAEIDPTLLSNLKNVYKALQGIGTDNDKRYSVVFTYNPTGLIYDAGKWKTPPTSWFDLASAETPGIVNVRLPDSQNTVAWLAIMAKTMNGVWPDKLADYNGVFDLVQKQLKPRLGAVLPTAGAMQSSFLDDPRSSLTVGPLNVSIAMAEKYKTKIAWTAPKEGAYLITTEAGVTKTPNKYWSHALIDYMLDADAQKSFAECGYYSPANALTTVGPEFDGRVIAGESNVAKIMQLPWDKISPIATELGRSFLSAVEN